MEQNAPQLSDEQIMSRITAEPDLYGIIIDRYTDKLSRYIKRVSGLVGDELDDVLQDVFVRAYQKHTSFDPSLSFNSWIYRICHNTTINYWKKNRRYKEGVSFDEETYTKSGFLDHVLADDTTFEGIMRDADIAIIRDALGGIKEKYRSILVLRFFEELDYGQISDVLKIPPGTVATNIHRAKKALAKEVTLLEQPKK